MYTVLLIALVIILALLFYRYTMKGKNKAVEKYTNKAADTDCNSVFAPAPTTMPQNAYANLMTPYMKKSDNNPDTKPTIDCSTGDKFNCTTDAKVCNTPWHIRAITPDTCAQYGIGESVSGPEGDTRCVCEARLKGSKGKLEKLDKKSLTADNIVIGINGVCTNDSQCCTGRCASMAGFDAKICQCPPGQFWNMAENKCVYNNWDAFPYPLQLPTDSTKSQTCLTTGKWTLSTADCSLGEAVTPDGFCACQVVPSGNYQEGKFMAGAKCTDSNQCINNLECAADKNGKGTFVCQPPKGLILEHDLDTNMYATCPNTEETWDPAQQKCVPFDQVKRVICPSKPTDTCNGNLSVGLGEYCDIPTHKAICAANIHTGAIYEGGRCTDNSQCDSKQCMHHKDGFGFCAPSRIAKISGCVYDNFTL